MMVDDSLERSQRSPWLPQFGLYKYESAENLHTDDYGPNPRYRRFSFGFLFLVGVLLLLFLMTYFIIADLSRTERIGVVDPKISPKIVDNESYPALVVELPNLFNRSVDKNISDDIELESHHTNSITTEPNNHKRFYTVEPQKLVFLPSRHLKPPKMDVVPPPIRTKRRPPNWLVKRRNQAPQPFNHYMQEPHPAPFKRLPTRRFYDPSLGLRPMMQDGFRPIVGSYRRAKATLPNYYHEMASQQRPVYVTPVYAHQSSVSTTPVVSYVADPFRKYKPLAPDDVNMLVAEQPSREQYLKNAQTLYQQVVKASRQKLKDLSRGESKKPFQLMLDVYPMHENTEETTKRPKIHFSPNAAKYNALNSINYDKNYDGAYFNRIRFAQLQGTKHNHDHLETAGSETVQIATGVEQPSQLVVHLNLFPKKKKRGNRRRRPLNYSVHEENSSEYLRRSSMESDDMYIDDEDLIMTDKNYVTSPMDVKSTAKPIAINFNFPGNCSKETKFEKKFVPMMDGNDNDVAASVPKAHDYPYRFASMPPAHVRQHFKRPYRIQNRMSSNVTNDNLFKNGAK